MCNSAVNVTPAALQSDSRGRFCLRCAAHLRGPDVVQILHRKCFLLDDKAKDLLQLLHILRLVQTVPQHDGQDVVLLDPFLQVGRTQETGGTSAPRGRTSVWSCGRSFTYGHALRSQPLLLLGVMPVGVVGHTRDHLVDFIKCIHFAIKRGNLQ